LPITEEGIWIEIRIAPLVRPRPALFLDRDGVIVCDTGYLSDPASVIIIPETATLIGKANQLGIPVVVVTNQSGIDRGLFDWAKFSAIEKSVADQLIELGAQTDATFACPFHPDHTPGYNQRHAHWRKPQPGLIMATAPKIGVALSSSWLIGDATRDIEAASKAHLAGGILIHDKTEENGLDPAKLATSSFQVILARTASLAAERALETNLFVKH
jgi:D-glycero-D-manno-heptose 1,7-bisphosphate phosphatase